MVAIPHFVIAVGLVGVLLGLTRGTHTKQKLIVYWIAAALGLMAAAIVHTISVGIPTDVVVGLLVLGSSEVFGRTMATVQPRVQNTR